MKRPVAKRPQASPAAEYLPTSSLNVWAENPRRNADAVDAVAASIERFGFGAPLVARKENRELIAGHTRLLAAQKLGLKVVPVRLLDISAVDAHLLALADNKTAEIAEWDEAALGLLIEEMSLGGVDLGAAGFDQKEIDQILADLAEERTGDIPEDPLPGRPTAPDSAAGEIYELGLHRLLCGDSTQDAAVRKAMGGKLADLLWTDPPYGVAYQSHMHEGGTATGFEPIENDDLTPEQLRAFLDAAFGVAVGAMREGAAAYVCHADQKPGIRPAFEAAFAAARLHLAATIAWVKPAATMGWQDYRNQYEPILYGWKGAGRRKVEDRTQTTVWEITRDAAGSYEHPTQKPVELIARAIRNSTVAGELVLDPFAGSGSTLIAAARTSRRAVLIEKDPGYCDVIRKRWENFQKKVGKDAQPESDSRTA